MVADLASSEMKTADYARKHGFHPSRVNWWRKELAKRDRKLSSAAPTTAFVAIAQQGETARVVAVPARASAVPARASAVIELVLDGRGTRTIRVPAGFDAETLRRLLTALEGPRC